MKKQFRVKHKRQPTSGLVNKLYIRRKPKTRQPTVREILERDAAKRKAKR